MKLGYHTGYWSAGPPPVVPDDDVEAAANRIRPSIALYIGGMGAKSMNFHADAFSRMGYPGEVQQIQQLYLAGHKGDAIAAVPTVMIEDIALIGPVAKIRDELQRWEDTVLTTVLIQADPRSLPAIADALS